MNKWRGELTKGQNIQLSAVQVYSQRGARGAVFHDIVLIVECSDGIPVCTLHIQIQQTHIHSHNTAVYKCKCKIYQLHSKYKAMQYIKRLLSYRDWWHMDSA